MANVCPHCGTLLHIQLPLDEASKNFEAPEFPNVQKFRRRGPIRMNSDDFHRLKNESEDEVWMSEEEVSGCSLVVLREEGMLEGNDWDSRLNSFNTYVRRVLEELDEIDVYQIEPAFGGRIGHQDDSLAAIRIGPGRWFACGAIGRRGLSLLISLLAVPFSIVSSAGKTLSFAQIVSKVFVKFPPGSVEFQVFESINEYSRAVRVIDQIAHEQHADSGLGTKPPETGDLVEMIGGREVDILRALVGLLCKGVVRSRSSNGPWTIVF